MTDPTIISGDLCQESWKLDPSTEQIRMKQTSLLLVDLEPALIQLRSHSVASGSRMQGGWHHVLPFVPPEARVAAH